MRYKHTISKNILKIKFDGDIIGEQNGPDLIELVNEKLNIGIKYSFLDISNVRYINSSGIGVLITVLTKFRNKKGDMYIINPSEYVQKLLIITKLETIFNIVESESEVSLP